MSKELEKAVESFRVSLAERIKAILAQRDPWPRQSDLAAQIGYTASALNTAINKPVEKLSDAMIEALDRKTTEFAGVLAELRALKDARFAEPAERKRVVAKEKERARKVRELRAMIETLERLLTEAEEEGRRGPRGR